MISAISRHWKSGNEKLCTMEHCLRFKRLSLPAGVEPRTARRAPIGERQKRINLFQEKKRANAFPTNWDKTDFFHPSPKIEYYSSET